MLQSRMDYKKELGLETSIVDSENYQNAVDHFRTRSILLPTLSQLTGPHEISKRIATELERIDPDEAHPLNLFRVHWYNGHDRRMLRKVPSYLMLPEALTRVPARIAVLLGNQFPLIQAHKVLAAYGCLVPRIVTGQFNPRRHRAIWPSTGNYCRGGIAISRILSCRGVAVLPERMSAERFHWLERWARDPSTDIVRTPGTESNVKEIYDKCRELAQNPENVVLNQFREFGNYLVHYLCTGHAVQRVIEEVTNLEKGVSPVAFVAATGSAGTIAAGDYLKDTCGTLTVAAEALECPTLLCNGYGEHNIQGIGDKHIPLIHNVMNTDVVAAISDRQTDCLNVLFNTQAGRNYLVRRRGVSLEFVKFLSALGLSSICNVLASIKVAKYLNLSEQDLIVTIATDGADLYASELEKTVKRRFSGVFDMIAASETWGHYLSATTTDHLLELNRRERERIFNLGYFTWVEQQGVSIEAFETRRSQTFWAALREIAREWDARIAEFNARTGVRAIWDERS